MRSASLAALLCLFVPAGSAQAKEWNFATGAPIGIGLAVGITKNADTDLVGTPVSTSADFGRYFAFEPFLDFGNFLLRFSGELHKNAVASNRSNSASPYGETSDVENYQYGVDLLLAPYVSESKRNRAFIKLGLARSILSGKNVRSYDNGTIYTEKFEGKGRELLLGLGFEFFLVQNYSLQLEGGFRQLEFDKLTYKASGTNLTGEEKTAGEYLLNENGTSKKINQNGAYFSVGLNLHF